MSASVLRRGLDLLSDDIKDSAKSQKKKKTTKKVSVMDQISTNKEGVKKQKRRLQAHSKAGKSKVTVKDKQIKNALEEYRRKQKKSQLSSNLKYFLETSYKTQETCTRKILTQNAGRLSRHQPDKPRGKQQKSIFSEEEFQKFQEEYFSNF